MADAPPLAPAPGDLHPRLLATAVEKARMESREREQVRLGQALHDTVCQSMGGINLLARIISQKAGKIAPELSPDLSELESMIEQTVGELHDLAHWLRPPGADGVRLADALTNLAKATSARIPCSVESADQFVLTDRYAALQLYSLARDAIRHAVERPGVERIRIQLFREAAVCRLVIQDDSPARGAHPGGVSVAETLQHRARLIGATLCLEEPATGGRVVECRLPLR